MRTLVGVAAALAVSASAAAEEGGGVPISLGVNSGVVAGSGPWRAAPSLDLTAAVGLGQSRFALVGGVGGWTFANGGQVGARSEVVASIGAAMRGGLSQHWTWSLAAAPALAFIDQAQVPMSYKPGLMLTPSVEFSTRRRTLGLTLGSRALFFADGTRLSLLAGVNYTFH